MVLDSEERAFTNKLLDLLKMQNEMQKQQLIVLRQLRRDIQLNHSELKLKGDKNNIHTQ